MKILTYYQSIARQKMTAAAQRRADRSLPGWEKGLFGWSEGQFHTQVKGESWTVSYNGDCEKDGAPQ